MAKPSFWSRMGQWVRASGRSEVHRSQSPVGGSYGADSVSRAGGRGGAESPASQDDPTPGFKIRPARPAPHLERLEQEYARVVNLVESIQSHLGSQAERSELIARSIDRLADSLGHLPEASKSQLDSLGKIHEEIAAQSAHARRLEESLSQLPQIADAQRETMVSIGRQLDLSRQTSEKVAGTLDGFQQAVTMLGEATAASAEALKEMRRDAAGREEHVASLLQSQTTRLTWLASVMIGFAVVAVVTGLIALLRQ